MHLPSIAWSAFEQHAQDPFGRGIVLRPSAIDAALHIELREHDAAAARARRPCRHDGHLRLAGPKDFLRSCIRCGECFKACPNDALQPKGIGAGVRNLWTPQLAADWSGCDPRCNNCGHVRPTGAVRALSLEEKRAAHMALALVDTIACLPHAVKEPCRICADECHLAGYDAIEFLRVRVQTGASGTPIEGSGFAAPVVLAERCVGCGLCQMRCFAINVQQQHLLVTNAIRVEAGEGREDRVVSGSYRTLREEERRAREEKRRSGTAGDKECLPDFLKE